MLQNKLKNTFLKGQKNSRLWTMNEVNDFENYTYKAIKRKGIMIYNLL